MDFHTLATIFAVTVGALLFFGLLMVIIFPKSHPEHMPDVVDEKRFETITEENAQDMINDYLETGVEPLALTLRKAESL